MNIATEYKEKILEEILREYLQSGTIPTADELTEAYEARVGTRDMTKPIIIDETHTVTESSYSSASALNSFVDRVTSDLEVLYQTTWDTYIDSMESFDRWRIELSSLRTELIDLDSRIDALLLLRQDTAGYFAFVEDNFVDFSKIDQPNTTAKVDISNHIVTMNENTTDKTYLNTNTLDTTDATFTILTRQNILSGSNAPGTQLVQAVADVSSHWQYRVRTIKQSKSISGELKLKLAASNVEVSNIVMKLHSSDTNSSMLITAQYSSDNYNWFNLPTDNYTQSVDHKAVFLFPATEMQWVRFVMTKTGPDDVDEGFYIYEFGAESIEFHGSTYSLTEGGLFVSKELSALDTDNTAIGFNKIALEVCQDLPDKTSIDYYVKAKNSSEETAWTRIDPYNVKNPRAATILDFGRVVLSEQTNLGNVRKDGVSGASSDSNTYFNQFNSITNNLCLISADTTTPTVPLILTGSSRENLLLNTISFYRNVGPQYGTSTTVREAPRGWKYDKTKTYLITTILVKNPDGITIELGNTSAELDNKPVTGSVFISGYNPGVSTGIHTFKTHIDNTGAVTGVYTNEEQFKSNDKRYPYNHQKLIEGYQYSTDFDGPQPYQGVDLYCESIARRVSIFDLINNTTDVDYSKYAIDTSVFSIGGVDTLALVFVVRFDPTITNDWANEVHSITYRTSNNIFDSIYLKAELASEDAAVTPNLTAYRIKLGV